MLHFLLIFMAAIVAAASIFPRGTIQTDVACSSDFSWASNRQRLSPCMVAAYVQSACFSGTWTVSKLQPNNHYDFGSDPCSCSWAVYNLLSACTACQNAAPDSILTWDSVSLSENCASLVSQTTYFPPNTPIPGGIWIPAWAALNPSTWQDGQFNVNEAKTYADQNHDDLDPTTIVSSPSPIIVPRPLTPAGPVGGVIGVVVCLGTIFIILKRRKANRQRRVPLLSQKTVTSGYTSAFADAPTSPAFTRRALSFFGSVFSTQTHLRATFSPAAIRMAPKNVIESFVVPPQLSAPSSRPPLHRKASSDTSTATRAHESSSRLEGGSRRLNAPSPAYTPSVSGPPGPASQTTRPGHRPGRGRKGSQDTLQSTMSHGSRNLNVARGGDSSASLPSHHRQTGSSDGLSGEILMA